MRQLLICAIGLLTILAAVSDWDWYFEHRKSKFFVDLMGRDGARVFYGILGLLIFVLGFFCEPSR